MFRNLLTQRMGHTIAMYKCHGLDFGQSSTSRTDCTSNLPGNSKVKGCEEHIVVDDPCGSSHCNNSSVRVDPPRTKVRLKACWAGWWTIKAIPLPCQVKQHLLYFLLSQTKGLPLQNQESPYVWDMFQDACKETMKDLHKHSNNLGCYCGNLIDANLLALVASAFLTCIPADAPRKYWNARLISSRGRLVG